MPAGIVARAPLLFAYRRRKRSTHERAARGDSQNESWQERRKRMNHRGHRGHGEQIGAQSRETQRPRENRLSRFLAALGMAVLALWSTAVAQEKPLYSIDQECTAFSDRK